MTGRSPRRRPGTDLSRLPKVGPSDSSQGLSDHVADQQGRRALFSTSAAAVDDSGAASLGALVIDCGDCEQRTVLSPLSVLPHAVPSLHLPYLRRGHGSWMRCPACGRRTWVSLKIQR